MIYPVAFPLHKICGNNIEMPAAALFPAIVLPLSSGNYFKVGNSLSIIAQRQFWSDVKFNYYSPCTGNLNLCGPWFVTYALFVFSGQTRISAIFIPSTVFCLRLHCLLSLWTKSPRRENLPVPCWSPRCDEDRGMDGRKGLGRHHAKVSWYIYRSYSSN